ncbi:MAG: DUF4115 domain-containing protein [Elusimicrobia bacterium]|nr:DUF4115 domain-containing protein [Elusimicrobiota bacterium]
MDTGKTLKEARESRGLTLVGVAAKIKISQDKLKALEENRFDYFPGAFYAKSFLKSYANFLEVSVDLSEIAVEPPREPQHPLYIPRNKPQKEKKYSVAAAKKKDNKLSIVAGIIIILGLLAYSVYNMPSVNIFPLKPQEKNQVYEIPADIESVSNEIMVKSITVEDTWIRIEADGKLQFEGTLLKGTTRYWKADRNIKLRIGYVPGIDIYLKKSSGTAYERVDIEEGSLHDINEVEFTNEFGK